MFMTAAFTGLRLGELLALEWRDVDFAGDAMRVRRSYNAHGGLGTPKSGRVCRNVRSRPSPGRRDRSPCAVNS
jgi:integrase